MRLLLDTNIVVMLAEGGERIPAAMRDIVIDPDTSLVVSVVAFWEMAIKYRSGKLRMVVPPDEVLDAMKNSGVEVLDLSSGHAVADPVLPPMHRDPFDRMFVAVAELELLTYLTTDKALRNHPLAWRP